MDVEFPSSSDDENLAELKASAPAKKGAKKRKKRVLSEPQKPASAYALFFRDTQAAIKAENSMATFGEISKIVASMWDSLSEEAKQVYKQKTETAKREYLKQLAAYRAAKDVDDDDSQPLLYLKAKMNRTSASNKDIPPPPKLKLAPSVMKKGAQFSVNDDGGTNDNAIILPKLTYSAGNSIPTQALPIQTLVLAPGANTTSPSLPPPIQLRNIVPKAQGGSITILQSKPGQIIKLIPASQTPASRESEDVQPILQTLAQETMDVTISNSIKVNGNGDNCDKEEVIFLDESDECDSPKNQERTDHNMQIDSVRICVRDGCENLAMTDPQWNGEYCSATCVVKHCRDVFDAWTSLQRTNITAG